MEKEERREIEIGKSCKAFAGTQSGGSVTLDFALRETEKGVELSICGNVWNRRHSDIITGGQCLDSLEEAIGGQYVNGWTRAMLRDVVGVWKRWHLNGMKAGCEHQRAAGWSLRPIDPAKPLDTYGKHFPGQRSPSRNMLTWVYRSEHPEGLLSEPCEVCGYKYGTAWLYEELPADVLLKVRAWMGLAV